MSTPDILTSESRTLRSYPTSVNYHTCNRVGSVLESLYVFARKVPGKEEEDTCRDSVGRKRRTHGWRCSQARRPPRGQGSGNDSPRGGSAPVAASLAGRPCPRSHPGNVLPPAATPPLDSSQLTWGKAVCPTGARGVLLEIGRASCRERV